MQQWLSTHLIEPFIYALAQEWQVADLVREKNHVAMTKTYIQETLEAQPLILNFTIQFLSVLFLVSVRFLSFRSFAQLESTQATCYVQRWRSSRFPGCAQLVQLLESLIAISIFSHLETYEVTRKT